MGDSVSAGYDMGYDKCPKCGEPSWRGHKCEGLPETAEWLKTQDNRATAVPIFAVQERVRDYGYDTTWGGASVWIDGANDNVEADAEEARILDAQEVLGEVPEEWTRVGYVDRWEFVQPFFTEAAANAYIEANRHNLTDPRTYVYSGHRNPEWREVRDLLLRTPEGPIDVEGEPAELELRRVEGGYIVRMGKAALPEVLTAVQIMDRLRALQPLAEGEPVASRWNTSKLYNFSGTWCTYITLDGERLTGYLGHADKAKAEKVREVLAHPPVTPEPTDGD